MFKPAARSPGDVLPWGHLAIGYLCVSLAVRARYRIPPQGPAVIAVAIGTQLPDLIDKPLAWRFGLIPSGRSLAHSLLFLAALAAIVWALAAQYDRRLEGSAFLGAYLSHVLADMFPAAMAGEWARLGALLWPITPVYEYPDEMDYSIIGFFLELEPAALVSPELGITILAIALWVFDGTPGIGTVVRGVRRHRSGSE
ncbi:metal-dependent hydrolase [Halorubrum sp. T3]|uniref:metal-dependent hydrolase n=1 Tax=Halorubrum sp. T3 TaxID=1194088 RepID=UPI002AA29AC7|nr:metal-dependent hydrolase [Halorubrum sp. T3]